MKNLPLPWILDDWALQGGAGAPVDNSIRLDAASLLARFGAEQDHALRVASFAMEIYRLAAAPGSRQSIPHALFLAACLHDIGHFVSEKGHHRHSAYLIENAAETRSWPAGLRAAAAAVARSHRKPWGGDWIRRRFRGDLEAARCAAILRIADGLDRGRLKQVRIVSGKASKDGFHLAVSGLDPLDAAHLLTHKADGWKPAFGHPFHLNTRMSP